jgi:hypothetical protein
MFRKVMSAGKKEKIYIYMLGEGGCLLVKENVLGGVVCW